MSIHSFNDANRLLAWAFELTARHRLPRAPSLHGITRALLGAAAERTGEVARTMFAEWALTAATEAELLACRALVADALAVANASMSDMPAFELALSPYPTAASRDEPDARVTEANDNRQPATFGEVDGELADISDHGDPDWLDDILERHDLWFRSFDETSAAQVLVEDAGDLLGEINATVEAGARISRPNVTTLQGCLQMIDDALRLAPLCERQPTPANFETDGDGTVRRVPVPTPQAAD